MASRALSRFFTRRPAPPPVEDLERGSALDAAAANALRDLRSLSELTARLAIDYLERIGRPISSLSQEGGVRLVSTGYAAHLAVEQDPDSLGITTVPVLGTLPDPRHGRPPQDLLLRVVKATHKPFPSISAVDPPTWEGFVGRCQDRLTDEVDRAVVDGILRVGWVLRQVDLRYGLSPERADDG